MTDARRPKTDERRIADRDLFEPSPSGDYRAVYAALGVDPDDVLDEREVGR